MTRDEIDSGLYELGFVLHLNKGGEYVLFIDTDVSKATEITDICFRLRKAQKLLIELEGLEKNERT